MKNKEKYSEKEPFSSVIAYTTVQREYVTRNPKATDRFPMYEDWMEMDAEDGEYSNVSNMLAKELFENIKKAGIDLSNVSGFKQAVDKFGDKIGFLSLMLHAEHKWEEHCKLNKEECDSEKQRKV
jgi:hypothetical protein